MLMSFVSLTIANNRCEIIVNIWQLWRYLHKTYHQSPHIHSESVVFFFSISSGSVRTFAVHIHDDDMYRVKICLITCALCLIFLSVDSIIIIHFISSLSHRHDLYTCAHVGSFSFEFACARDSCALLTVMFTTAAQPNEGRETLNFHNGKIQ